MVDHHQPERPVKILDCCVQGQHHSEHSEVQLMFVWTSSELLSVKFSRMYFYYESNYLNEMSKLLLICRERLVFILSIIWGMWNYVFYV